MAAGAETLSNHKVLYHIVKGNGRQSTGTSSEPDSLIRMGH
jgi:hypothetical protein